MRLSGLDVFIYLRKSRRDIEEEQKLALEGKTYDTLERHRKQLLKLARDEKHIVIGVYEEVVSGENLAERPKIQEMLKDIQDKPIDAILVMDIDRLGRGDMADQGTIFRVLKYTETKIITPLEVIDPADDSQELTFSIKSLIAREELKSINKRMQRGLRLSASEGKHVGSNAPYGYQKDENKKLVVDKETAWVVQKIFDLYVNEGLGGGVISDKLNELKIPSPSGRLWSKQGIRRILDREAYAGDIYYRKTKQTKTQGKHRKYNVPVEEMVIAKDVHEPIVSREMFEMAQNMKEKNTISRVNKSLKLKNYYAGLLRCEVCETLLSYDSTDKRYPFFRCPSTKCKRLKVQKGVSAKNLDAAMAESLEQLLQNFKLKAKKSTSENSKSSLIIGLEKQLLHKQKELTTAHTQSDEMYDLLEQKVYDINTFTLRQAKVTEKINGLNLEIKSLEATLDEEKAKIERVDYKKLAKRLEKVLDAFSKTDNIEKKNRLLKSVLEKIVFKRPKESVSPTDFSITLYPKF